MKCTIAFALALLRAAARAGTEKTVPPTPGAVDRPAPAPAVDSNDVLPFDSSADGYLRRLGTSKTLPPTDYVGRPEAAAESNDLAWFDVDDEPVRRLGTSKTLPPTDYVGRPTPFPSPIDDGEPVRKL